MPLADSLRLAWFRGLTEAVQRRGIGTETLLSSRGNTVVAVKPGEFHLLSGNPRDATTYFAHEADRFASAAFESLLTGGRNEEFPRSTAWFLIRCYYAAFFALHSLLRIKGLACTRIAASSLIGINRDAATLFGKNEPYHAGLYQIVLDNDSRTLLCTKLNSGQGGTHEALWSLLQPYLTELVSTVLAGPNEEHQDLVVLVDSFQRVLRSKGGAQWFTRLRNSINYSHAMGAWFPYHGSMTDYDRVSLSISGWSVPPQVLVSEADELVQFTGACKFLVSTCATTVRDISFRSVSNSPFRKSSGLLLRGAA